MDQLYPGDSTSTLVILFYDSIPAYKHDQKEKPMWKYCHRLKNQPKIAIFAKKCIFQMTFSEEASTSMCVYQLNHVNIIIIKQF